MTLKILMTSMDFLTLTNLTALIAQTPIKDFTSRMNWDLVGQFLEVLGLEEIIPLDTLKTFLEDVEEVLENPYLDDFYHKNTKCTLIEI